MNYNRLETCESTQTQSLAREANLLSNLKGAIQKISAVVKSPTISELLLSLVVAEVYTLFSYIVKLQSTVGLGTVIITSEFWKGNKPDKSEVEPQHNWRPDSCFTAVTGITNKKLCVRSGL